MALESEEFWFKPKFCKLPAVGPLESHSTSLAFNFIVWEGGRASYLTSVIKGLIDLTPIMSLGEGLTGINHLKSVSFITT